MNNLSISPDVLNVVISLGLPGLAFYLFYHYALSRIGFSFSQIGPVFSGIIFIIFIIVFGGLTFYALYKFNPPEPSSVSHSGELRNLVAQLEKDTNARMSIRLTGPSDDRGLLAKLFFSNTTAPTYSDLIEKLCASKSQCMGCTISQQGELTIISISKIGKIEQTCLDEGAKVYCCA